MMRDPQGRLFLHKEGAVRVLSQPLADDDFLHQKIAHQLVENKKLVPFAFDPRDEKIINVPLYEFVTYPTEWTDAQIRKAALLTLEIARDILPHGYELKDASAWNIIYDGCAPIFCDHFSVASITTSQWWAFGQFCRHFIFPLAASRWRDLRAHEIFHLYRDGLDVNKARSLLGARGYFSHLAPLLLAKGGMKKQPTALEDKNSHAHKLHKSLIDYGHYSVSKWQKKAEKSAWSAYVVARNHYSKVAIQEKLEVIQQWLDADRPRVLLDLGCNTGEFSRLALNFSHKVIALDYDHDSVERLYISMEGDRRLYPLVADLSDLRGGRGWDGKEFTSLSQRLAGQSDAVLMLALIHHIHISESIPLTVIAEFAASLTRNSLIIEFIEPEDPMAQQLAQSRRRSLEGFTLDQQIRAFEKHFIICDHKIVSGTHRHLYWLKKRP